MPDGINLHFSQVKSKELYGAAVGERVIVVFSESVLKIE